MQRRNIYCFKVFLNKITKRTQGGVTLMMNQDCGGVNTTFMDVSNVSHVHRHHDVHVHAEFLDRQAAVLLQLISERQWAWPNQGRRLVCRRQAPVSCFLHEHG